MFMMEIYKDLCSNRGRYLATQRWPSLSRQVSRCFTLMNFHPGVSPLFTLVLHAKQVIGLEAELCTIPLHRPVIKQCLILADFMESFALGLLNLFNLIDCNLMWEHSFQSEYHASINWILLLLFYVFVLINLISILYVIDHASGVGLFLSK